MNLFKLILFSKTLLVFVWLLFIHYTPQGIATLDRNIISGEITLNKKMGINFSYPWVQSTKIDLRPTRYCLDCSCSNMNCYLAQFDELGLDDFIKKEGWSYYWLRNRLSFNMGHQNEWRGWDNVLRGYVLDSDHEFKFIKRTKEI